MGHLRCLLATLLGASCHAQSSLTLYGVVDVFGQYVVGASHTARLGSGGLQGSRVGLHGVEDLGDGFEAVFTLETGNNVDDGTVAQGGLFWGRQAFVGLKSG